MNEMVDTPERLWRTQFDNQMTEELAERLIKQTIALTRRIERGTRWRDGRGPEDRLHGAIEKTLARERVWNTDRVDLAGFLYGVISSELSIEVEHASEFPHASRDDQRINAEKIERETSDALDQMRASKEEIPKEHWWCAILAKLRQLVAEDDSASRILDAYEHGHVDRRDVLAFTKMSSRRYHGAYNRLVRAAQQADDETRALVDWAMS
jgi:hypothetical protein